MRAPRVGPLGDGCARRRPEERRGGGGQGAGCGSDEWRPTEGRSGVLRAGVLAPTT